MRALVLCLLTACGHPPAVARAPVTVVRVAAAPEPEPEVDEATLAKLPDYQPIQSFLERTSPPIDLPKVHVTLTPTEGPMSLERKALETAATMCFNPLASHDAVEVTMTLETRADGTIMNGSIDGTSAELGSCLIGHLAKVPIHEEGKPEHIVVLMAVTFG